MSWKELLMEPCQLGNVEWQLQGEAWSTEVGGEARAEWG